MVVRVVVFLAIVFLTGCGSKKIVITPEYIINPYWDEQANFFQVQRLILNKDSTIDFLNKSQAEVMGKFVVDSSFIYHARVKIEPFQDYQTAKIYFNEPNRFYWSDSNTEGATRKVIGNLLQGNWYRFLHLRTYKYDVYVYVYVDSLNKIHRWDVEYSNF